MIDIHSHILPGIDDGSRSIEESMELVKKACSNGVTDLIVTPHYMVGSDYIVNNADKKKLLDKLKRRVKKEGLEINLYIGNEVFIENNMVSLKKSKEIAALNNSKYLLFELPLNYTFNGVSDVLFDLRANGIIPVIAHPERYAFVKKDPSVIEDLIDKGALFQSNIGSFLGVYGKKAKETAILLLKHNAISFMGSDIHRKENLFYERINEVKKVLRKYVDDEEIENLFSNNAQKIIDKEIINTKDYIPFKKNIFGKWK